MADVFVSYARSDKARVAPLVAAIEAQGWSVWWDPEIDAGQQFDDQIEAELKAAKAVVVVWTPTSVASRWVRGEAREAADRGTLVPVRFDGANLPMDVRAIHTTDLDHWGEDAQSPPFQALLRALSAMIVRQGGSNASTATHGSARSAAPAAASRIGICVLPFANMSGDAEQEYFSDGISEDIITDLNKVSALFVVARNTAFTFKGKSLDVAQVARQLKVSHVLEGSVRKAGGRVRITAQLIEGDSGGQIWAERYDRDLNDIFALQDEISEAIVKALRLKLLPEEKQAIEQRGTDNVDAYNLYLMARQNYATGDRAGPQACRGQHPHVSPGHRNRSRLCAGLGADGARADADAFRPWTARGRRHGGRGTGARAGRRPGRGPCRQGADPFPVRPPRRGIRGDRYRAAPRSRVLRGQQVGGVPATSAAPPGRGHSLLRESDDPHGDGRQLADHADDLLRRRRRCREREACRARRAGPCRKDPRAGPEQRGRHGLWSLCARMPWGGRARPGVDQPRAADRSRQHEHALQLCLLPDGPEGDGGRAGTARSRACRPRTSTG